ncbi:hypothetical protein, partial [Treponema sp. R6D11]
MADYHIGNVVNSGITDPCNMGAAMAPAAYDTIKKVLKKGDVYDKIITGDLGEFGSKMLQKLIHVKNHIDAGAEFLKGTKYDTHQG